MTEPREDQSATPGEVRCPVCGSLPSGFCTAFHLPHAMGEVAKRETELDEYWDEVKVNPRKLSPEDQKKRREHMKTELTQIAAMCARAIVELDR